MGSVCSSANDEKGGAEEKAPIQFSSGAGPAGAQGQNIERQSSILTNAKAAARQSAREARTSHRMSVRQSFHDAGFQEEDGDIPEDAHDWFSQLFGFFEPCGNLQEYQKCRAKFKYDRKTGMLSCRKRKFVAGFFETPQLQALRDRFKANESQINQLLGGKLTLREDFGDVSLMHTKAENRYALFQVASQFNALEHVSQDDIPENGITCYADDITQGPACATACAAGTIVRNYFAFETSGQTQFEQVRNLKAIEEEIDNKNQKYFEVSSGYTMSTDQDLERLQTLLQDKELVEKLKSKLFIAVQKETEVVASGFGEDLYTGAPLQQLVTQAYCSAIPISYTECEQDLWADFARLILEAAYEATMYVAVENAMRHRGEEGSKKIFLTALGGGVFGNEMWWVEDAMVKAISKISHLGLEIIMVSFDRSTPEFVSVVDKFS